jgi:hypothetical protein
MSVCHHELIFEYSFLPIAKRVISEVSISMKFRLRTDVLEISTRYRCSLRNSAQPGKAEGREHRFLETFRYNPVHLDPASCKDRKIPRTIGFICSAAFYRSLPNT